MEAYARRLVDAVIFGVPVIVPTTSDKFGRAGSLANRSLEIGHCPMSWKLTS